MLDYGWEPLLKIVQPQQCLLLLIYWGQHLLVEKIK